MKHLRVLKHLFKRVPRHFWLHWNFEVKKGKNPSTWRMVHASNEIENKALCLESLSIWECSWNFQPEILLNGKGPWCQFWELPQKTSSSRLVQNGSTLTKLELVTISSDKLNMLWPSFTLGSDMYYLFFSWHLSYIHTLPWPKTSQAQIWNQNIHSCQYPAGIFDLLSAFISCWFSSSLGHPTWYFFQS